MLAQRPMTGHTNQRGYRFLFDSAGAPSSSEMPHKFDVRNERLKFVTGQVKQRAVMLDCVPHCFGWQVVPNTQSFSLSSSRSVS